MRQTAINPALWTSAKPERVGPSLCWRGSPSRAYINFRPCLDDKPPSMFAWHGFGCEELPQKSPLQLFWASRLSTVAAAEAFPARGTFATTRPLLDAQGASGIDIPKSRSPIPSCNQAHIDRSWCSMERARLEAAGHSRFSFPGVLVPGHPPLLLGHLFRSGSKGEKVKHRDGQLQMRSVIGITLSARQHAAIDRTRVSTLRCCVTYTNARAAMSRKQGEVLPFSATGRLVRWAPTGSLVLTLVPYPSHCVWSLLKTWRGL